MSASSRQRPLQEQLNVYPFPQEVVGLDLESGSGPHMCIEAGFYSTRELQWEQLRLAEAVLSRALLSGDFDPLSAYIADDALFIHDGRRWRVKAKIAARWSQLIRRSARTFRWKASRYALLEHGTVAIVAGLVSELPSHKVIGAFESTWRHDGARWAVVLFNVCSIEEFMSRTRRLLTDIATTTQEKCDAKDD
jgi:ketosteroid isomerase-like protein